MGIKKTILIVLLIALSFIAYMYFDYTKKVNYLEDLYERGGAGIVADVDYFLSLKFEITGELPKESEISDFLPKVSEALFSNNNYSLKIDYFENDICLYSFGPSGKNNKLKNKIDARLYMNMDGDYLQGYSFIKYLFNGSYDILLFKGKIKYDCNDRSDYKHIFYTTTDSIFFKDKKAEVKLNSILSKLELESGHSKDYYESSIYIYNNEEESLKLMCSKSGLQIGKEKEEQLLNLLKAEFSDYKYVKFSVAR